MKPLGFSKHDRSHLQDGPSQQLINPVMFNSFKDLVSNDLFNIFLMA